jgi:hypothetical protein
MEVFSGQNLPYVPSKFLPVQLHRDKEKEREIEKRERKIDRKRENIKRLRSKMEDHSGQNLPYAIVYFVEGNFLCICYDFCNLSFISSFSYVCLIFFDHLCSEW